MLTKKQINSIKKFILKEDDQIPIIFKALGETVRCRIFKILMKHGEICVSDIAKILGITVSAASQQLRILERVGLVRKERMGQMICYQIRSDEPRVKRFYKLFL